MQNATTAFAQFLSIVPKSVFAKLSKQHKPKRTPRTFSQWSHSVHLLHAQLTGCKSLRDGIMGMNAATNRLYHLGVKTVPGPPLPTPITSALMSFLKPCSANSTRGVFLKRQNTNFLLKTSCSALTHRSSTCA
jgi:hypothetical protein